MHPAQVEATPATRPERDVGRHTQMRKQQRILQQQAHPAIAGGHLHPGPGIGQHPITGADHALIGPQQPRDHVQQGRLSGAVGPQDRQHLARRDVQTHVQATLSDHRLQGEPTGLDAHPMLPSRRAPTTSTTTAATATSNSDIAAAASASDTRCR